MQGALENVFKRLLEEPIARGNQGLVMEKVLLRLLREDAESAPDVADVGVVVRREEGNTMAVAFSTDRVESAIEEMKQSGNDLDSLFNAILAMVVIGPPGKYDGPLRGAMEVKMVAGQGKLAYGMAYALAGNKGIVPDRRSVSKKARAAWSGVAWSLRKREPIDNMNAPEHKSGEETDEHPYHTDDPKDDGKTWGPDSDGEALDFVYYPMGWESGMLQKMKANVADLRKKFNDLPDSFFKGLEKEIISQGDAFFSSRYLR